MEKKLISLIIVLAIIIIVSFIGYTMIFSSGKTVDVGDASFNLPEGYSIGSINSEGDTNITNGNYSIFIKEYNNDNISRYINKYTDSLEKKNKTFECSNLTVDNMTISRVEVEKKTVHYWFVHDKKVYTIYTWDNINGIDSIVIDLIKSIKSKS